MAPGTSLSLVPRLPEPEPGQHPPGRRRRTGRSRTNSDVSRLRSSSLRAERQWAERTSSHSAWASLLILLPAVVVFSDNEVWSLYGAPWLQPVAISRKSAQRRSGRNKQKPLPSVATGCRDGKEGVDGSSPSEGFSFLPAQSSLSFSALTPTGSFDVHPASTSVHASSSGALSASRSLMACSRPSRARWP